MKGPVKFKARYEPNVFDVTWKDYDGKGSDRLIEKIAYGQTPTDVGIDVAREPYERKGFRFLGWNTSSDDDIVTGLLGADDALTCALVFYPKWEKVEYKITYDLNLLNENNDEGAYRSEMPEEAPSSYFFDEEGKEGNIELLNPGKRPGYSFLHWFEEGDDENVAISFIDPSERAEDLTLVASWAPVVSIFLPVATHRSVSFAIDAASGLFADSAGATEERAVRLVTTCPHSVYLEASSQANEEIATTGALFPHEGSTLTDVTDFFASLAFRYTADRKESDLKIDSPSVFSFSINGAVADDARIRILGSEMLADDGVVEPAESVCEGVLRIMMGDSPGTLVDAQVPLDRLGVRATSDESTKLATIVWTVSL